MIEGITNFLDNCEQVLETIAHEFNKGLKAFFDGFAELERMYIATFDATIQNTKEFKYKRLAIVTYLACYPFFGFMPMLLSSLVIFGFMILATWVYVVLKEV